MLPIAISFFLGMFSASLLIAIVMAIICVGTSYYDEDDDNNYKYWYDD